MAYTKGPWEIEKFDDWDKEILINGTSIIVDHDDVDQEEAVANANLIAAAPELLEALEETRKALIGYEFSDATRMASRAIKKAKGEANE